MNNLYNQDKPFCLIKRRDDTKILYLSGEIQFLDRLDQIPRKSGASSFLTEEFDSLSILPFRQVEELGFMARHNNEKIICLKSEKQRWLEIDECLATLPEESVAIGSTGVFSPDDAGYAARVQ